MPVGDYGRRTRRLQFIEVFAANHSPNPAAPPEPTHDPAEQVRQQAVPELPTPTEAPGGSFGASDSPAFRGPVTWRIAPVRGFHARRGCACRFRRFRRFVTLVLHGLAGNCLIVENAAPAERILSSGESNSIVPEQGWHGDCP